MRIRAFCVAAAILAAWLTLSPSAAHADEWSWVAGDSTQDYNGVYGTQGVPAPGNKPGARYACSGALAGDGGLWLFGGVGYPASGGSGDLNDLWKFDGTNWTWVTGSSVANAFGTYGTVGVPGGQPGGRRDYAAWCDSAGVFWIFGGRGYAGSGSFTYLSDLWKYDGTNWTWLSGPNVGGWLGTYGTKGVPASGNLPGARYGAMTWRDAAGNLWLFGGYGYAASAMGYLNDLWKWDGTYWTWVAGANVPDQFGSYGTKGVSGATNQPGTRRHSNSWTAANGELWLFGGYGLDGGSTQGYMNDLWRFDGTYWTWMGGSNTASQLGAYGTLGVASPTNQPGARLAAARWQLGNGDVWVHGGFGSDAANVGRTLADLWKWDGTNWTWMAGSNLGNQGNVHGSKGVPSPLVTPGSRQGAASWFDPDAGTLWLLGGMGYSYTGNFASFGDLWARPLDALQPADLTVSALSLPGSLDNGCSPVRVRFTVTNEGGDAGESEAGVYLSTDAVITTGDRLLGTIAVPELAASASHADSLDVTLPEFTADSMCVGVIADHGGDVEESDETDNTAAAVVRDRSPRLLAIADVLNDQGRWVRIRFARSSRDVAGSETPVLQYEAFRRVDDDALTADPPAPRATLAPAGPALAGWEFAAAVPAHGEDEYSMVVPTLKDSSSHGAGYSAFFVRAATAVPTTFFDSCRDSGYSVDNLPPAVPAPFAGTAVPEGNALHWGANLEMDLALYRLHRGTGAGFTPGPGNLVAELADTGYVDVGGACFYKLCAVDVNGNESGYALAEIASGAGVTPPVPGRPALGPAVPNPAGHGSAWQLALPRAARVRAEVYDASGRLVRRLADADHEAGVQPLAWDLRDTAGRRASSGTYYLRVQVDGGPLLGSVTVRR
jgi:N-acetylneuraminic acid mutarotase